MNRTIVIILASVAVTITAALAIGMAARPPQSSTPASASITGCKVGVYDSRAIAIAYGGSKYNDVSAKMKQMQQAKAAGDQKKIDELNAWGQKHQRQLHRQGFARVPVADLLEPVKDQLPALSEKLGVSAIVFECNYTGPNVEKVDVTMDLVKLYEPSEQAMKWIKESMNKPPIDLDEIDREKH